MTKGFINYCMNDYLYFTFVTLFFFIIIAIFYIHHLRRERHELNHQLRRVLRASTNRLDAQECEIQMFRTICELIPHSLFITNFKKGVVYANSASQKIFGPITIGEGAIRWLRNHHIDELLDQALQRGQTETDQLTFIDKQFLVTACTWQDLDGSNGIAVVMQDVTELNRLARARRDMAANLSHELRTPLASIKLMVESLQFGALEEADLAKEFINRIGTENNALIRLIEDLTTLSWIERGRTLLRLERINLRELTERRLQRLTAQQQIKNLEFNLNSPPIVMVDIDPERFGQVITNVLDNAIKLSPVGGTIDVIITINSSHITLAIKDEGPGILPSDLPRIFERFYKGDRSRTRSNKVGTGLGLAIVKHLVEAHGGTIRAKNNLTRGATFTIILPH